MRLGLLHSTDRAAHRVDLDPLAAVLTAQVLVQEALETALPDHLAAPVSPLLELLVVGLADVAQQVRGETARRIDALGLDLGDDARQLELPLLDLRDVLEGEAAAHAYGQERVGRHPRHGVRQVLIWDVEQRGHAAEDGVAALLVARQLARNEREREGGTVGDQRHPVTIEQDAARRRDGTHTDPVLVRRVEEPAALEDLEIPELADEDEKRKDHGRRDHHDALVPGVATRQRPARYAHGRPPSRRPRIVCAQARARTTAAPMKPLQSACGSTTYIISSPNGAGKRKICRSANRASPSAIVSTTSPGTCSGGCLTRSPA